MRRRFQPDLDHQRAAIEAVCDLFRGVEGPEDPDLPDAELLENLWVVQDRNGLPRSPALASASPSAACWFASLPRVVASSPSAVGRESWLARSAYSRDRSNSPRRSYRLASATSAST